MFKNQYQGGPSVEIFSAQGKNPGAKWRIFGNPSAIWKEYDKETKGFVFVLEGSNQINRMQLPKETRQTLGLIQPFLTLQILVPLGQDFSTELLITDLGNIKRRLYLSTVHKELSVTPLHAKIPLFMIKRKIWCNLCIDLVAFTSEIFRGAIFQSLDGIIISANCKLRKIFTLKSKPQDTAEENDQRVVSFTPCEPTDVIPRSCQLNADVPQVTQLLNLAKIHKPETKCRSSPVTMQETARLVNRGQGNKSSSKTQDVSHIAFGSKILGPPPSSNRRVSTRISGEVTKTVGSKSDRSYRLQSPEKRTESLQNTERLELSFSPCSHSLGQGDKRYNTHQAAKDVHQNDEWVFPESSTENIQLDGSEQHAATQGSACCDLTSLETAFIEDQHDEMVDCNMNHKEIFTFSSRPRSAPHGKSPNTSPECCIFPLDLKQDSKYVQGETQPEDNFQGSDSSEEDDNSDFIRSTENLEISCSRQGTPDSAAFKDNTLKRISQRNEYWKNKGCSKQNLEESTVPKPQSSTVPKTEPISPQTTLKPTLSLSPTGSKTEFFKVIPSVSEKTEKPERVSGQIKSSVSKNPLKKVSRENLCLTTQTCEYDWKNYQSGRLSASELQMLASMKRQQNEELKDTEVSHGLSASEIDNCNVNISTSSDDTTTWNSCFPPRLVGCVQSPHYSCKPEIGRPQKIFIKSEYSR
ncbi:protein CFAP20DC isoform X3 [Excalfactoria chinensis]|uniref:protein CFAP20DC isoform X3 n=1 Tax=Excalfactoria chinensis TaxID=46218 RepID=UPI003B3A17DF